MVEKPHSTITVLGTISSFSLHLSTSLCLSVSLFLSFPDRLCVCVCVKIRFVLFDCILMMRLVEMARGGFVCCSSISSSSIIINSSSSSSSSSDDEITPKFGVRMQMSSQSC